MSLIPIDMSASEAASALIAITASSKKRESKPAAETSDRREITAAFHQASHDERYDSGMVKAHKFEARHKPNTRMFDYPSTIGRRTFNRPIADLFTYSLAVFKPMVKHSVVIPHSFESVFYVRAQPGNTLLVRNTSAAVVMHGCLRRDIQGLIKLNLPDLRQHKFSGLNIESKTTSVRMFASFNMRRVGRSAADAAGAAAIAPDLIVTVYLGEICNANAYGLVYVSMRPL
jgi:hypothetical protein